MAQAFAQQFGVHTASAEAAPETAAPPTKRAASAASAGAAPETAARRSRQLDGSPRTARVDGLANSCSWPRQKSEQRQEQRRSQEQVWHSCSWPWTARDYHESDRVWPTSRKQPTLRVGASRSTLARIALLRTSLFDLIACRSFSMDCLIVPIASGMSFTLLKLDCKAVACLGAALVSISFRHALCVLV